MSVAVGHTVSCARLDNGEARCWGDIDPVGPRIGDDPTESAAVVELGGRITQLAGAETMCALVDDDQTKCRWSSAEADPDGESPPDRPISALRVIEHGAVTRWASSGAKSCAVFADGTLWCWRSSMRSLNEHNEVFVDAPIVEIDMSRTRTCVLMETGEVACWGANRQGSLNADRMEAWIVQPLAPGEQALVAFDEPATQVAVNDELVCALLAGGDVQCFGDSLAVRVNLGAAQVRRIRASPGHMLAGGGYVCAVMDDGAVKCWNRAGADREVPSIPLGEGARAVDVAVGWKHTCALLDDGRVRCWGEDSQGQVMSGGRRAIGDDPGEMGAALVPVRLVGD